MSYRHILGKLLNFDLLRVREKQMSELVDKNILLPHRQAQGGHTWYLINLEARVSRNSCPVTKVTHVSTFTS